MDTHTFDEWNDRTTTLQNKHGFRGVSANTGKYAKKTRSEINPNNKPILFPLSNIKFPNGEHKASYEGTSMKGTDVFLTKKEPKEKRCFVNTDGKRIDLRSVKWFYRIQGEV